MMFLNPEELFTKAFDLNSNIIYYPIRHHSPACSMHLQKTIAEFKPEIILIEGADDADNLIPFLAAPDTKPPVCIYYSYDDKKSLVSPEKEKYRAYYPFLEYSPEYQAIKTGTLLGLEIHFIDIPYAQILTNSSAEKNLQFDFLNDDIDKVSYSNLLAERSGCRNFSEFWEKFFELPALSENTSAFVKSVMALGFYMRNSSDKSDNYTLENVLREKHMYDNILKYKKSGKKILVVAGAYHISGLLSPENTPKLKSFDKSSSSLYLMPYTFTETDSHSGYGAGMPFPAFYQSVWKKLISQNAVSAYEDTVLEFIVKTARGIRKKQPVSVPDEINTLVTAKYLADLRDKKSVGCFEMIDAVKSTFIKGSISESARFELDYLFRLISGMTAGKITHSETNTPPLITDFYQQCKIFRIKANSTVISETTLEIVKNPAHFEKNCFFHRLSFLNTGFCKIISGPDYVTGRNKNLIRQQWKYKYSSRVEATLIDLSVFGESIKGVCTELIKERINENMGGNLLGRTLIQIHIMGLDSLLTEIYNMISDVILYDSDLLSMNGLVSNLKNVISMQKVRSVDISDTLSALELAFTSAVRLIPNFTTPENEIIDDICKAIKNLYSISLEYPELCSKDILCCTLSAIIKKDISPQIYGVSIAVLFKCSKITSDDYSEYVYNYLATAGGMESAEFLNGVFLAGREVLFTDRRILKQIDKIISQFSHKEFIGILPALRYAFTNFIPSETARISSSIAAEYGTDDLSLMGSVNFSRQEIEQAITADKFAKQSLLKWGFL